MPAATYERNMSIINVALRSDCNRASPWLVFVVAKNVRAELTDLIRVGIARRFGHHQGLKPDSLL